MRAIIRPGVEAPENEEAERHHGVVSYDKLAVRYGCSKESVRNIERYAIDNLLAGLFGGVRRIGTPQEGDTRPHVKRYSFAHYFIVTEGLRVIEKHMCDMAGVER